MAKRKAHGTRGQFIHWRYCLRCGMVHLKNEASRKEAKKECPGSDDDQRP